MAEKYMSMRNLRFQLHEVLNVEQLTKFNKFSEHTKDGFDMMLDSAKQVTGRAGDYQVEGAKTVATYNVGGSGTTNCSFIVAAD